MWACGITFLVLLRLTSSSMIGLDGGSSDLHIHVKRHRQSSHGATAADKEAFLAHLPPWYLYGPQPWPAILDPLTKPNFTVEQTWYGQDKEDALAYTHFFHNRFGGTYLELGALDGVTFSNTKFFSESLGWRGLLIEANPVEYLKIPINRPNAIAVNAAICGHHTNVHFVQSRGAVGGIWEFMAEPFKRQFHADLNNDTLPANSVVIPCMPLRSILSKFGLKRIDMFSLDVEGAELEVLKSFDFDDVHVDVVVIEQDGHNPQKDADVRELMASNNFELRFKSGAEGVRNDWFVHKDFVPSPNRQILAHP